jgi:hypothetical protein
MIIADHATKRHVLSARPTAPRRAPRQRGDAIRRLAVTALRRLADGIEPRCIEPRCAGVSSPAA